MFPYRRTKYNGKRFGEYTIESPIGEGKYGLCFLAKSSSDQKVVIKKFKRTLLKKASDESVYEAVILSKLKDKRIPEFLGVINEKNFYGFVLEFKNGFTVEDMLFRYHHEFSNEEFFIIGLKVIRIIKYLHESGVVHRDIRPPNVLIDNDEVYLLDFGLARWADNSKYPYDLDFSYLGDFLLYLLYSSFHPKEKHKKSSWYDELQLTFNQKLFFKKLLRIEIEYKNIYDIELDFIKLFKTYETLA